MKLIYAFGAIFVSGIFLWGRVVYDSRYEFHKGLEQQIKGQKSEAIVHFGRSIHWYAPLNPYVPKSLEHLWNIGKECEESDRRNALLAYDEMRGSIYSIRHFLRPFQEWLPRVNERIAELRAKDQVLKNSTLPYEKALAFHKKVLQTTERPSVFWVLLLEFGFLGWIASIFGFIWLGFDSEGKMFFSSSFPWIVSIIIFFVLWIIGLVHA